MLLANPQANIGSTRKYRCIGVFDEERGEFVGIGRREEPATVMLNSERLLPLYIDKRCRSITTDGSRRSVHLPCRGDDRPVARAAAQIAR